MRLGRNMPLIPARIWWCSHEPDEPSNEVDQPFLQGQLGLDLADPAQIWAMLEFCEASPTEQRRMADPAISAPVGNRRGAFQTAPMSRWKQERARRITAAEFAYQIADLLWTREHASGEPKNEPRTAIDLMRAPTPF